jgi:hypothetical protein
VLELAAHQGADLGVLHSAHVGVGDDEQRTLALAVCGQCSRQCEVGEHTAVLASRVCNGQGVAVAQHGLHRGECLCFGRYRTQRCEMDR